MEIYQAVTKNNFSSLFDGSVDDRLPAMSRVINLSHEATQRLTR